MRPSATVSTSPPATADRGAVALDLLELWVRDLRATRRELTTTFGFEPRDLPFEPGDDEEVALLVCGGVRLVIRQGATLTSSITQHVERHGDTVADVVLVCTGADAVLERARRHGLEVFSGERPKIDMTGDGTICHSVASTPRVPDAGPPAHALPMIGVDHVACCLPHGAIEKVARAYRDVLGLVDVNAGDAQTVGGGPGMRSAPLRSPRGFTMVLTEPASSSRGGQTQRFLEAHAGPGIQHAAITYDDLPAAVRALQSRGVEFLHAPSLYYEQSRKRLAGEDLPWDTLRQLDILVDADEDGLLFQLFARPITSRGTFFFELIQRSGASGFGANNVRALFAAIEEANRAQAESSQREEH